MSTKIDRLLKTDADELSKILKHENLKIVFAESCTGGMVAATLTGIPGISEHLCGSFVVYRNDSKARWLGISRRALEDPGPVSEHIARLMVAEALKRTPEAHLAAAITGNISPDDDGRLFVSVALRGMKELKDVLVSEFSLIPGAGSSRKPRKNFRANTVSRRDKKAEIISREARLENQKYASHAVLFMVRSLLKFAR